MSSKKQLVTRVEKSIRHALVKKGYISLCSIVESQYNANQKYPLSLRKNKNFLSICGSSMYKSNPNTFDLSTHKYAKPKNIVKERYKELKSLHDLY
ncbi:hypothetical protein [Photobacterium leiognathi]|uniref:hypothetical protein n=1 Tax=Photobacterium leiognathi TaxID=553611 RepID=UPI0011B20472|nr:hypothetical protein [Photobacterium leiognathi]